MFSRFKDQEFTFSWMELLLIVFLLIACLLACYVMGYRLGTRSGYDSAMLEAVATMERLPLKEDFNKEPSIEDISNIYARLTDTDETTEEKIKLQAAKKTKLAEEAAALALKAASDNIPPAIESEQSNVDLTEAPKAATIEINNEQVIPELPDFPKITKGWYVQIAAPRALEDAYHYINKLKASGFVGYIDKIMVDEKVYFRVLTGPESSKVYADRLRDQVAREDFVETTPFVREY